jgi:hypothetical protein
MTTRRGDRSTGDIVQVEVEINGPDSPPAHGVVWSRIRSALYAETRWIELVAREGYRSGDRSVRVSAAALNSAKAAARV